MHTKDRIGRVDGGGPLALRAPATQAELESDLSDLAAIARSTERRLENVFAGVRRSRRSFSPRTYSTHIAQLRSARSALSGYAREIDELLREERPIRALRRAKLTYIDLLRMQVGVAASLMTAADWQSPPIASAGGPLAGRFEGLVREHLDDYKRDRHPDAAEFETAFLRAYVDVPPGTSVRALMTSCGMSAFTTILAFLTMEPVLGTRPVVAGRALYHECRDLLAASPLERRLVWVDEADTKGVIDTIDRIHPAAVFVDSLSNARGLLLPDLRAILSHVADTSTSDVYVVVDNTCLSVTCQPWRWILRNGNVRPLVFESLTKYGQFGLDRTAAGIIVALEREAEILSGYREHLGTNVADACVAVVPWPDRTRLERRLHRIGRNAVALGRAVDAVCRGGPGPVVGACHPALPGHPSHRHATELSFAGGFFALELAPSWDTPSGHQRVSHELLRAAARERVPLVWGASFGFDTTRIYRTATLSAHGPFLRIAAGTEDDDAIDDLARLLTAVLGRRSSPVRRARVTKPDL
jgi:cystathionine beta-lyase/cystathionine gamma-synthase